jgi:threonine dehydrogenase-like Zn-dependent dehydrogenase
MKGIIKKNKEAWSLSRAEIPVPGIGNGDVLVKIWSAGVCHTDVTILENKYIGRKPVPVPMVLGHEGAGEIVDVGPGISRSRIGERVAIEPIGGCGSCYQCLTGNKNLCSQWDHIGITRDGTFAEYISLPSIQAHTISAGVDYSVAAVAEPFGLVVRSLEKARLMLGETVAIVGPGAIGLMHLQAFKAAGASKVIMVGLEKDRKRFTLAEKAGADHCVMADKESALEAVMEYTRGTGADVVIETASSPKATSQAFDIAGPHGRVILFGLYPKAEFSPVQMLRNAVSAFGDVGQVTRHFVQGLRIMESGMLDFSPIIDTGFSLEQAEEALKASISGETLKVVFSL